jgi:sporulation protein YlmC with PRC-barrel domain
MITSLAGFPEPDMKPGEIRFEDLLGKTIRNSYGRAIGRIEEARVAPAGEDYLVTEFLIGPLELWPRLLAFMGELPPLRALGMGSQRRLRPVPWHWIDLSDPERPVLGGEDGEGGEGGRKR